MAWIQSMLPWIALGTVVILFSLSDDLPDARVRRVAVAVGLVLLALGAVAAGSSPRSGPWGLPIVAAGPFLYLLLHHLLRQAFRKWTGKEPNLMVTGMGDGTSRRFFYERNTIRRTNWLDFLYSFLLGISMLLSAAPAIGWVIEAGG